MKKSKKDINDVFLDEIICIRKKKSTTEYVYDFTVEKTRNFAIFNGLIVRDTFHKAGSCEKQPVVSKFAELLNATNKPKAPYYKIYFKQANKSISDLRENIGNSIVQIDLKKITKDLKICLNKEPENWYESFFIIYEKKPEKFKHCISIKLNLDILFEFKLKIEEIANRIKTEYSDTFCVFSPDYFGQLDIYFDTDNIELDEEKLLFVNKENAVEIYLEEVVVPILQNIQLCGISGILNMFFVKDKEEWIVETENSREKTVEKGLIGEKKKNTINSSKRFKRLLGHDIVDGHKTLSNNIWDIYQTFGIEATRQYMIDEFSSIMEGINISHVMLLVDKMTFTGTISSISRYTMRREDSGPFGKASFEETLDNFLKAGVFGEKEPTTGVSASIICAKRASIGTGLCELSVDLEKILEESD